MSISGDRILLKTPLSDSTGYGKDGIYLSILLEEAGGDVNLEPTFVAVPIPARTAALLTKSRPEHFEVAITHIDPKQLNFPEALPKAADKVVGWSMWEFTSFGTQPEEWVPGLREQFSRLDLLLAYDEWSKQAFSEYMDEPERIKILQGGYDADFWRAKDSDPARVWDGTFVFSMNGTMNQRKNPFAAINAFKLLKDEYGDQFDAELHLKTTSPNLHPAMEAWCPGLKIHYTSWTTTQLRQFYLKTNCLLAPSWGEGKNLPALEAQGMGAAAIVSKCAGHLQWASEDWTYLVDGPMEEHLPGMGSIRIDPEVLAEKMWYVYNNRDEAKRKGAVAAKILPAQSDWSRVVERLKYILSDVTPRTR